MKNPAAQAVNSSDPTNPDDDAIIGKIYSRRCALQMLGQRLRRTGDVQQRADQKHDIETGVWKGKMLSASGLNSGRWLRVEAAQHAGMAPPSQPRQQRTVALTDIGHVLRRR